VALAHHRDDFKRARRHRDVSRRVGFRRRRQRNVDALAPPRAPPAPSPRNTCKRHNNKKKPRTSRGFF
jgi:hypothetical protein